MKKLFKAILLILLPYGLQTVLAQETPDLYRIENGKFILSTAGASHLAALPLKCMQQGFPYKTGITFTDSSLTVSPKNYHPSFFGCFDWHSSVHGHWMLVRLLKLYPNLPEAETIRKKLSQNLSKENINVEVAIFKQDAQRGFERTYGWAWLLQLQQELAG